MIPLDQGTRKRTGDPRMVMRVHAEGLFSVPENRSCARLAHIRAYNGRMTALHQNRARPRSLAP